MMNSLSSHIFSDASLHRTTYIRYKQNLIFGGELSYFSQAQPAEKKATKGVKAYQSEAANMKKSFKFSL